MNNSVIAMWLRLLAGNDDNYEKLLDWLACAPDLDKPLCGLILAGPPQTGKSLFAEGLRQVWRHVLDKSTPILVCRDDPKALSFIDPITIEAYPRRRFVVATRDPAILLAHVHKRTKLQQLERRYLYLEHTEEAAEYLAFHKDRPLDQWATWAIADTTTWLSENRKVKRAGHLWVKGTPGAMRHLEGATT